MTKTKKIGVAILLVTLIAAMAVVAVLALEANPTKPITVTEYELSSYLGRYDRAGSKDARATIMAEIEKYLATGNYDATEPGIFERFADVKDRKISLVEEYLADVTSTDEKITPAVKVESLNSAKRWFASAFPEGETVDGDYLEKYNQIEDTINTSVSGVASSIYSLVKDVTKDDFLDDEKGPVSGYNVKLLRSFMKANDAAFDKDSDEYKTLYTNYAKVSLLYNETIAEAKEALYRETPLNEYDMPVSYKTGFEGKDKNPTISNPSGTNSLGLTVKTEVVTESELLYNSDGSPKLDENGVQLENHYRTMRFLDAKASTYYNITYSGAGNGIVFECDITTFGNFVDGEILFQTRPDAHTNTWLKISSAGKLEYRTGQNSYKVAADNIIVPGEWTHISVIYNPKAEHNQNKLYIDYVLVASDVDLDYDNCGAVPSNMRIGNGSNTTGEFSIDNISFTAGTAHRDETYIARLESNNEEYFTFLGYHMNSTEAGIPARVNAYDKLGDKMPLFATEGDDGSYVVKEEYSSNTKITAVVNSYNAFDKDALEREFKDANIKKLEAAVKALKEVKFAEVEDDDETEEDERETSLSAYVKNLKTALANVNFIISSNAGYFPEGEKYNNCLAAVAEAEAQIALDTNIIDFINTMNAFDGNNSIVFLQSKYKDAVTIKSAIGNERFDSIVANTSEVYQLKYKYLRAANEVFKNANETIGETAQERNSKDIINYVDYLSGRFPEDSQWKINLIDTTGLKGDALLAAEKNNADFAFIEEYVARIRALVNAGNYAGYVDGIGAAIQKFERFNAHYFEILQERHAEAIGEQLRAFAATDSYIEKSGVLAYLDRYIANNEVDFAHEKIAPLYTSIQDLKAELSGQIESYEELLSQNTIYFVNKVQLFDTVITYSEKKALYEEAAAYYYTMNSYAEGVDVAEAVRIFNETETELRFVEDMSAEFVRSVLLMPTAKNATETYRYLIDATLVYEYIDESVEGVRSAKRTYKTAYDAYFEYATTSNGEIAESTTAIGSMRANCGLSVIISAVIDRLFAIIK